jgi:hypothetical protein
MKMEHACLRYTPLRIRLARRDRDCVSPCPETLISQFALDATYVDREHPSLPVWRSLASRYQRCYDSRRRGTARRQDSGGLPRWRNPHPRAGRAALGERPTSRHDAHLPEFFRSPRILAMGLDRASRWASRRRRLSRIGDGANDAPLLREADWPSPWRMARQRRAPRRRSGLKRRGFMAVILNVSRAASHWTLETIAPISPDQTPRPAHAAATSAPRQQHRNPATR